MRDMHSIVKINKAYALKVVNGPTTHPLDADVSIIFTENSTEVSCHFIKIFPYFFGFNIYVRFLFTKNRT